MSTLIRLMSVLKETIQGQEETVESTDIIKLQSLFKRSLPLLVLIRIPITQFFCFQYSFWPHFKCRPGPALLNRLSHKRLCSHNAGLSDIKTT